MDAPDQWQVLESCPVADEATWLRHATAFVAAFVVPAKRERWLDLLTRRPRQIFGNSHKLHSALDRRTCRKVGDVPPASLRGEGIFYAFSDAPKVVPTKHAELVAGGSDALFSLVPGELVLYFFHENEVWLCGARRGAV